MIVRNAPETAEFPLPSNETQTSCARGVSSRVERLGDGASWLRAGGDEVVVEHGVEQQVAFLAANLLCLELSLERRRRPLHVERASLGLRREPTRVRASCVCVCFPFEKESRRERRLCASSLRRLRESTTCLDNISTESSRETTAVGGGEGGGVVPLLCLTLFSPQTLFYALYRETMRIKRETRVL